jgi:hypothetical protein
VTGRRALAWALVAGLCVAALTAVSAILTGDFDETDGRVIGTSLGFAVFSATAASGAALRFRASVKLRALGVLTMFLSGLSFLLLLFALWSDDGDAPWRWFGSAALAALAGSHASLVSGARRRTDVLAVAALAGTSILLAVVDAGAGILAVSGAVDDGEGFGQVGAALVVLLLLTTALPPILRRIQRPAATPPSEGFAAEVRAAADRIETLNADPGNRAPEIARECARLRELARAHAG